MADTPNIDSVRARQARKPISKTVRFEIFKRDQFTCQYCGSTPPTAVLHVEHIVAVAKGGDNSEGNLTTACSICNAGKGVRSLNVVPQSMAETAARVAEQESQIAGYAAVMRARDKRIEDDCWTVVKLLLGPETTSVNRSVFQSIKGFVKRLPVHEIADAIEITLTKFPRGQKQFPYFCGVCWSKIKNKGFAK